MSRHYSEDELKGIGKQCGNKLPPASAVQAMFLYEMQRDTELESLFQGQMFFLAEAEDQSQSQEARIIELEEQVKALQTKVAAKDMDERLATSKVRTDALQAKLGQQARRMDSQGERLVLMEVKLDALSLTNKAKNDEPGSGALARQLESVKADLTSADLDIQVLFDERDCLVTLLEQAKARITSLEGNVRALTGQCSSRGSNASSATGSPPLTQLLPVKTNNGDLIDLAVPKGKPHVPHKRDEIRTFTPGKQWMA